jgi:hypothetical protein
MDGETNIGVPSDFGSLRQRRSRASVAPKPSAIQRSVSLKLAAVDNDSIFWFAIPSYRVVEDRS